MNRFLEFLKDYEAVILILFGAVLSHFLEKGRTIDTALFEAKRKNYAELLGVARNSVQLIDYPSISKITNSVSEALLLAGPELRPKIADYGNKVTRLYTMYGYGMTQKNPPEEQANLVQIIKEMQALMKKELGTK
jgi:hypothetical protein